MAGGPQAAKRSSSSIGFLLSTLARLVRRRGRVFEITARAFLGRDLAGEARATYVEVVPARIRL